jgi:hypothetical protein
MHIFDAVVICEAINQDILLLMLTTTFEVAEATML